MYEYVITNPVHFQLIQHRNESDFLSCMCMNVPKNQVVMIDRSINKIQDIKKQLIYYIMCFILFLLDIHTDKPV